MNAPIHTCRVIRRALSVTCCGAMTCRGITAPGPVQCLVTAPARAESVEDALAQYDAYGTLGRATLEGRDGVEGGRGQGACPRLVA